MLTQPVVTVLMSVFNSAATLPEAVQSILGQTFRDFEFLIIDDCSEDESTNFLPALQDPRVRVLRNERNLGLTRSLKKGVELVRSKYIARMDADDVALPQRLEKQVARMERHPEIGLLGSECYVVDEHGQQLGFLHPPEEDVQIRWRIFFASAFAHPSVMLRRDVLTKNGLNYDESFRTTQDYDLFTRMLNYTRGANLREPLMRYRVHSGSMSSKASQDQLRSADIIALRTINEQFPAIDISVEQVRQLRRLYASAKPALQLESGSADPSELYLDMFEAFVNRHSGEPGLKTLKRQETVKVASSILRPPLHPRFVHLTARLLAIYPYLPWPLLLYESRVAGHRLRLRLLDAFNHR